MRHRRQTDRYSYSVCGRGIFLFFVFVSMTTRICAVFVRTITICSPTAIIDTNLCREWRSWQCEAKMFSHIYRNCVWERGSSNNKIAKALCFCTPFRFLFTEFRSGTLCEFKWHSIEVDQTFGPVFNGYFCYFLKMRSPSRPALNNCRRWTGGRRRRPGAADVEHKTNRHLSFHPPHPHREEANKLHGNTPFIENIGSSAIHTHTTSI